MSSRKAIKHVSLVYLDFKSVLRMTDRQVVDLFQFVRNSTKNNGIPKRLDANAYKVDKSPTSVTIHF